MIRKLLLLLGILLVSQTISFGQGAEIFANCFYQSASQRIVVRLALRNPTGSSSGQMGLVGMRFGFQYNAAAVTYTGFQSFMYNSTNPGLNDAGFLGFIGPDTNPTTTSNLESPSSRTATINTGGTKVMQLQYINRSTDDCFSTVFIPAGNVKILIDIYFTLVNNNPEYYNLNNSLYGFGDPQFIAQFLTKDNGGHTGNLADSYKEIAIISIRQGSTTNPYQPFDNSNETCKNGSNINPIVVTGDNVNFISPINGVLSGKVESLTAMEKNNNIQLDWKVDNNELVDHYEIERKDENGEFKTIALVMSDNKYSTTSYQLNDKITSRDQQLYYRVKTVNIDEIITYSDVKTIKLRSVQQPNIKIYPNPSSNFIRVDLPASNGTFICRIYNNEGRMVKIENISNLNSNIPINKLSNGSYFIEMYNAQSGKRFYSQFTKQ